MLKRPPVPSALLVGLALLLPVSSRAQVVPGDYGDTVVAVDPASGVLTGYHESFRIGRGNAEAPQFGCSFFFVGAPLPVAPPRGHAEEEIFRIEASSDAEALALGESEASGELDFLDGEIAFVFDGHGPPGCLNVQGAGGFFAALRRPEEWRRVGVVRERAAFRSDPAHAAAGFHVSAGRLAYVLEERGCWLHAEFRGPRTPLPSWARLPDGEPVQRGWVHASALHLVSEDAACRSPAAAPASARHRKFR